MSVQGRFIEQSPLSRTIKELESDLGTQLFERTTRSTRLTWAGQVLLNDVRRLFTVLDQARDNVRAAASGYRGVVRIALSDGIVPQRFSSLLARCREQEPEIEIRLFEVPLARQIRGLRSGVYDVGFSRLAEAGEGLEATPIWTDQLVVVMPSRHPLLVYKRVSIREVVNYPLILADPETSEGWYRQIEGMLRSVDSAPVIAERVGSQDLLLALIAAGYGVGFACEQQLAHVHNSSVVTRPLDGAFSMVTAGLEQHLQGRAIGSYFDLIAGTSTGGIIAIGLAMGLRASELLVAPNDIELSPLGVSMSARHELLFLGSRGCGVSRREIAEIVGQFPFVLCAYPSFGDQPYITNYRIYDDRVGETTTSLLFSGRNPRRSAVRYIADVVQRVPPRRLWPKSGHCRMPLSLLAANRPIFPK